jgi:hypothetical protein
MDGHTHRQGEIRRFDTDVRYGESSKLRVRRLSLVERASALIKKRPCLRQVRRHSNSVLHLLAGRPFHTLEFENGVAELKNIQLFSRAIR